LHKFEDPKDKRTYLFTHLEPFNCNRWFPCFDQPDLRAHLNLAVASQKEDWKLVANTLEEEVLTDKA